MEVGTEETRIWEPDELASILKHQMSAAVQLDLSCVGRNAAAKLGALSESGGLLIKSFADLLWHPNPPVELLELTKDFAKACGRHPDSPLPPEAADILYLASIVVARMRCRKRITTLDDASLRQGLGRAIGQAWLDERTRALLQEGLVYLASNPTATT